MLSRKGLRFTDPGDPIAFQGIPAVGIEPTHSCEYWILSLVIYLRSLTKLPKNCQKLQVRKIKPEGQKEKKQWPIVRPVEHRNGAKAWIVDCRVQGKGERLFFKTKPEADTSASQKRTTRKNEGVAGVTIPEHLRIEALRCQQRLEAVNATLTEAVDFFLKHAKPAGGKKSLADGIADLLASKRSAGKRESYVRILGWVLNAFERDFAGRSVHEIARQDLELWLDAINNISTRKNRIRDLSILFEFCLRRGYCGSNPLEHIERPIVTAERPEIFTVTEAEALLTEAKTHPELGLVPTIAIGLFAGLRVSEIKQLDWRNIDLRQKVIDIDAKIAKTRQQRNVTIVAGLCDWLRPYAKTEGPVVPAGFRAKLLQLRKFAKVVKWPDNGLRHSFGSYHVARYQNPNLTALQMGHTTTDMLFKHYRNYRITKKEAAQFWQIKPSAAKRKRILEVAT